MRIALTNFTRRAGMVLACATFVFTAGFVFWGGAAAASVGTQKKAAASAPVAAKTAVPVQAKAVAAKPVESVAKSENTGIKVHGHWVINILNSGGKLVSHTEFENTLQASGQIILANVLGQQGILGGWAISFAGTGPCTFLPSNFTNLPGVSTAGGICMLFQNGAEFTVGDTVPTSTDCNTFPGDCVAALPAPTVGPGSILLAGAFVFPPTTPAGSNIAQVETLLALCPTSVPESTCVGGNPDTGVSPIHPAVNVFTSATLTNSASPPVATPIPVAAGQVAQISVTLSFQ